MIVKNHNLLTLQADEIDHLTIRYTDFGEHLNKPKACDMIHFYVSAYDEVSHRLKEIKTDYSSLSDKTESELYDILVVIRNVLLDAVFEEENPCSGL